MATPKAAAKIIDAWVQPWPADAVAKMPQRIFTLSDRIEGGARMRSGIPLETLIEEMDEAGVDTALCSAGPLIPNEAVIDAVTRYPDRLLGVAAVNPWSPDGVMTAVHELRSLVGDYGFKGLKLEPFILDKVPTEAQWYPLYAACTDLDITVQIQVGGTGPSNYTSETGRPGHIDRVAIDFPELAHRRRTHRLAVDRGDGRGRRQAPQRVDRRQRASAQVLPTAVRPLPAHLWPAQVHLGQRLADPHLRVRLRRTRRRWA